jgi:hypothetical protein
MATTSTSDSSPLDSQAGVGPAAGCGRFLVGHQRSPSVTGPSNRGLVETHDDLVGWLPACQAQRSPTSAASTQ